MGKGTRVIDLFAGVGGLSEMISKFVDTIVNTMLKQFADTLSEFSEGVLSGLHEAAHIILSFFGAIFRFSSKKNAMVCAYYAIPMHVPNLKHITINFLEHAGEVRKQYLLTRHHRGNTDDTDTSFSCNLITVF